MQRAWRAPKDGQRRRARASPEAAKVGALAGAVHLRQRAGAQASAVRRKNPGTERSQPPPHECVGGSAEDPRLVTIRTGLVLVVALCDKGLFGFRVVEGLAACS